MKIKKSLIESTKLIEDEESSGVAIETGGADGGVTATADVVVTAEGEPKTKASALKIENALTKMLDLALAEAKDAIADGEYDLNCNVLVKGLPGSSKTKTIKQWCLNNGCNIYYLDAKNPDIQLLTSGAGSIDREDPKHPEVRQAYSAALNKLERPNSILFLDELNRQIKEYLRGSLLSLVADRSVAGDTEDGFRYFNNLLFTIAAINPPTNDQERKVMRLNDAEKRRFYYHVIFNSEVPTTTEYLSKYYDDKLTRYATEYKANPENSDLVRRVHEAALSQYIGKFLVNDPSFHYSDLDTYADDIANADAEDKSIVCQSIITELLRHSHGKIDNIKRDVSKIVERGREMIVSILNKLPEIIYSDAFKDKLLASKARELGIDLSFAMSDKTVKAEEPKAEKPTTTEEPAKKEYDFSGEDDDKDFASSEVDADRLARGKASSAEISSDLAGAMASWGLEK